MVALSGSRSRVRRAANFALITVIFSFSLTSALASGPDEAPLDATTLMRMEERAEAAQPRDQCYLFTEVLHGLTELAGRQIAAGDTIDAAATIERINAVAARVQQSSSADARHLKNAEELLQHTTRRLTDMAHIVSGSEHAAMQTTLQHLDRVHTQVLSLVFAR
ncbi:MAG TPA: hypothetical protein VHY48_05075 [Acidobacteriaceae bacterium]|jgi:hypothetical protein|nr:hypothetical protein [Acidobacteriaceae bacterium]